MDLIASVRFLARRKAVAAAAVLTMALALGANTAAFSVVRAFLFSGFAVPEPDRLVVIAPQRELPGSGLVLFNDAYPNFELLRRTQRAFADVACFVQNIVSWDDRGEIRPLQATLATASFFATVRVQPVLGRTFTREEEGPSPAPVVVLSHALWQGALAGDPGVVGRALTINGVPTTVIGVMPEGFTQPVPTDIWQPFDLPEAQRTVIAGGRILTIVGRLADGRNREAAVADLAAFTDRTHRASSVDNDPYHYVMLTLREQLLDGAGATVLLVQAGAVALLLLAVLNLASLLIAWGFERRQEIAVRIAVGAGRWRVARLLVTQSAIVVTIGCAAGLGLAYTALAAVRQVDLGVTLAFFFAHLRVDGTVLLASAAITGLASLVAGLLPVWFSRRADLAEALRGSSRAVTLSAGALRWQKAMVVAQTALSIVVVSAATLIGLTFRNLASVPDGFASHDRAVGRITLADPPYTTHASRVRFADAFLAALERESALKSFGFTNTLPVGDAPWGGRFLVPAADGSTTGDPSLFHFRRVSPDYLRTMAIPLVRGRYFDAHDDSAATRVAIVSAALGDTYYPGQNPLGKQLYRVTRGSAPPQVLRIVGVVGNVMDAGYNAPPGPAVYVPYAQVSVARLSIVAESRTTAEAGLAAIRRALGAADPVVAASAATTMDALVEQANALPRLRAVVLLAFALIAVVIVGLGSYGVMRQLVANREREFALRLVFGALPNHLGRAVYAQIARLTVPGVAAGLVVTWALAGVMRAFVFGIGPRSIPVLASVSGGVLLLAALAAAPSALRAMRVDARGSVTAA